MDQKKFKAEVKWKVQRVKNLWHFVRAVWAVARNGYPARKLTVIGVTGTDGKTTTCTLIYEILKAAGYKTGLISTVSAKIGDEEIDTGFHTTNPDATLMQKIIARMVKEGVTHLVLEVTAHGLDQYRVMGCNFYIGVLTNITHEHLDDFIDMTRYQNTKLKLFKRVKYAVLNQDDPSYKMINVKTIPYGKTKIRNIAEVLAGDYNKYNIGAAEAVVGILKVNKRLSDQVIKSFGGVPGRREEVKAGQKFRVIVDFAHTPNALEQVLKQLKKELPENKKLIAVFGATGERDKTKRPMMGEAASRLADVVIITSDDTRMESQDEIAEQIMSGINKRYSDKVIKINDRREAIRRAFKMAKAGDIVLIAGKGHEKTILIGKQDRPWSDAGVAREEIDKLRPIM
ncbi:hypothetical protein A2972_04905 [Candidatus Amesbacteria bacterium RIFCSPLOWO2_01_FULL_47_33]|uniref:UDP-N-acetylmuramyl-tripeptide synthetase n=2 Tax=Candidatus Amesiibacteriota TaxID=1752730 RepID=A0A1F4Z1U8_9BACT|nr:MAG: hypothetical protein A2972_04905 [Candidatus Amesbacteria bacterium RIFCSPLOWO2_01_FULL_47_33]